MGDTIWVDVRGRSADDVPSDNSIMLRLQDQLDRLSKKLKVAKLSDFYDYSDLEAAYGEFGDDPEGDPAAADALPEGAWYDPEPALAAVRAIHDHLEEHPEDLGFRPDRPRAHWPGALMEELAHCRSVLEDAVARGQQFRFLVVA
jgi:hypothetical protein